MVKLWGALGGSAGDKGREVVISRSDERGDTWEKIGRDEREGCQERERQKGGEWIEDLQGTEEDGWIGGGRVGMSNSISPNEDKSKEKSDRLPRGWLDIKK